MNGELVCKEKNNNRIQLLKVRNLFFIVSSFKLPIQFFLNPLKWHIENSKNKLKLNRIMFAWIQTSPIEQRIHKNDVISGVSQTINHSTRSNINYYQYKLKGVNCNLENFRRIYFHGNWKIIAKELYSLINKRDSVWSNGLQMQTNVQCLAIRHSIFN